MKFILSIIFIFSIAANIFANVNPSLVNIEWQKKYLEEDMKEKIKSKLNTVLENEKYVLDIEIKTTTPKKPNFKQSPKQQPEEVKFTNAKSSTPGDYIVFSKFGLESPITANMQAKDTPKNSEYEYLWKFQESQSIFNNLEAVNVQIGLPDVLTQEQKSMIEELVKSTKFNIKDFSVNFEFKYLDLKTLKLFDAKKKAQEEAAKSGAIDEKTMDLISELATPIGMLLAAIIISICALILFKKYAKLRGELLQSKIQLEGNNQVDNKGNDESEESGEMGIAAAADSTESSSNEHISGVERFIKTLDESPDTIYLLIKDWIKTSNKTARHALVFLLDKLETAHLRLLFSQLSQSERQEWKGLVEETPFSRINAKEVDQYINTSIVNSYMVPDEVEDTELKSKLLSLNPEGATRFVKDNSDLAALFLSISPSHLINNVLASFDLHQREELLSSAAKVDISSQQSLLTKLSEKITPYTTSVSVSPFVEKIISMIPNASFEDEASLYKILFESNIHEKIKQLALANFPSFLMNNLSLNSLNTVFMSFPMSQRAEIIESFEDQAVKDLYISSFAKEGSTALEMYNLEIERFVIDESAAVALEENRKANVELFFTRTRQAIANEAALSSDAKSVIENWVQGTREDNGDLKLVS